jgi:beta-glucosidase
VQQPIMVEAHNRAYEAIKKASGGRIEVGVTLAMNDERRAPGESGYERKLGELYLPWFEAEGDYIGVQNYTYAVVGPDADLPPDEGVELTQMNYPFAPEALAGAIRMTASRCKKPIYVTENGVATEDDARRVAFIDGAVAGLRACVNDGIDVRGYFHWSLLDNWEWFHGYGPKFGLVSWDPETFARTPKPSAVHLGQIAKADLLRRAKA